MSLISSNAESLVKNPRESIHVTNNWELVKTYEITKRSQKSIPLFNRLIYDNTSNDLPFPAAVWYL